MPSPNSVPRFKEDGVAVSVAISTLNPNLDGTGTLGTVVTAGTQGTLIELIRIIATGVTTAGMVRLFIDDGSAIRLYKEIAITAVTPSATVKAFEVDFLPATELILPTGYFLKASTEKAEEFIVRAVGGDL